MRIYLRQGSTRERRRLGVRVSGGHLCEAEAPTEPGGENVTTVPCYGDGIAGAEPQKIGLAIGKGKALMRCMSWRMTALRTGVPRKSAVF